MANRTHLFTFTGAQKLPKFPGGSSRWFDEVCRGGLVLFRDEGEVDVTFPENNVVVVPPGGMTDSGSRLTCWVAGDLTGLIYYGSRAGRESLAEALKSAPSDLDPATGPVTIPEEFMSETEYPIRPAYWLRREPRGEPLEDADGYKGRPCDVVTPPE